MNYFCLHVCDCMDLAVYWNFWKRRLSRCNKLGVFFFHCYGQIAHFIYLYQHSEIIIGCGKTSPKNTRLTKQWVHSCWFLYLKVSNVSGLIILFFDWYVSLHCIHKRIYYKLRFIFIFLVLFLWSNNISHNFISLKAIRYFDTPWTKEHVEQNSEYMHIEFFVQVWSI